MCLLKKFLFGLHNYYLLYASKFKLHIIINGKDLRKQCRMGAVTYTYVIYVPALIYILESALVTAA
jgi:hypothetical protein